MAKKWLKNKLVFLTFKSFILLLTNSVEWHLAASSKIATLFYSLATMNGFIIVSK